MGENYRAANRARLCLSRLSVVDTHRIENGGAGGNRTPVHQALFTSDTTIPVLVLTQHHRRVGYLIAEIACCLSNRSMVFLIVSVLSRRHPPLLLPGCDELAPCAIAGHDVSLPLKN